MFDFPDTPTLNQTVTGSNGCLYRWDGTKWTASSSVPDVAANNVGRNLIHNSMFRIQQRGVGPFTVNGAYLADRWELFNNLNTASVALGNARQGGISGIDDLTSYISVTVTGNAAVGSYTQIVQRIEGVARLSGKTVTVTIRGNCNSGTPKVAITLEQNFGTGGSPSAPVSTTTQYLTFTTTNTTYSLTFTLPSTTSKTMGANGNDYTQLAITFSNQYDANIGVQSNQFFISAVQLEIGSVATPLEKLDIQTDLANCQRFYQFHNYVKALQYTGAGGLFGMEYPLPVTMRAAPTATPSGTTYSNASNLVVDAITINVLSLYATGTAAGHAHFTTSVTISADL